MRRPASRISPPTWRSGGSSSPMIAPPVMDFPAPDSPTTPSTSPSAMSKEASSTASNVPRRVAISTRRLRTERSGSAIAEPGIERVAQPVAEQIHRQARARPAPPPDTIEIHQSPENRNSLPMRTSEPSEGCVGGTPTPRKRERRLGENREREIDRRDDEDRPDAHWAGCALSDDAQRRYAGHRGREHILLVALDQHEAAHRAGILHPDRRRRSRRPAPGWRARRGWRGRSRCA